MNKEGKRNRNVKENIETDGRMTIGLKRIELVQLVRKGIIKPETKAKELYLSLCKALEIEPRVLGRMGLEKKLQLVSGNPTLTIKYLVEQKIAELEKAGKKK